MNKIIDYTKMMVAKKLQRSAFLLLLVSLITWSCTTEPYDIEPAIDNVSNDQAQTANIIIVPNGSYQIDEPDDWSPLYRFHLNDDQMKLESDPTVTYWGTDYWGYWTNPFPFANNTLTYTFGLSTSTYDFFVQEDGRIDVNQTIVVQPYLSGSPRTIFKHLGLYSPIE